MVEKQVKNIDAGLEHEITKVMTDMGKALSSISLQFTKDYTALVSAMQKIVEKGTPAGNLKDSFKS